MTGRGARLRSFSSARDWALRHPVLVTLIAALAIRLLAAVFISASGWERMSAGHG